ncbi:MAG: ABC transporter permease [Candidatus Omnitrophota bacterium]
MRYEWLISWRYLLTRRKEKFISLISVISVLGIAVGVMALIVVIAVMSGFDKDLREKIIGNYSHITVSAPQGLKDYAQLAAKLKDFEHVAAVSPYISGQALVDTGKPFALGIKGIDPKSEGSVTKIKEYLVKGDLNSLTQGTIIIGKEMASYLALDVGMSLKMYFSVGKPTTLKIVGIFNSGMYDYDVNLAFVSLDTAQALFGMENMASAISVKLDDPARAEAVKNLIDSQLRFEYRVMTWGQANKNFFSALALEKLTMFVILSLIVLVAAFNIISTLIVMVVQKTKDIGILKAIGVSQAGIRRIFTFEGLIIGFTGIILGAGAGLGLCFLLKKYQFIKLPSDIYYIDKLPVSVQMWPDVALIVIAAAFITMVSTIYPAAKAARLKTTEALRYE